MSTCVYPADHHKNECCCGGKLSYDCEGSEVGCITGHRALRPVKVSYLRGDPPARRPSSCPIHRRPQNCNGNNINCSVHRSKKQLELKNMADKTENGPKIKYKEIIYIWYKAVEDLKKGSWEDAYNGLETIKDYSAIMRFNLGQVALVLNREESAKENFLLAVEKDSHMALGHFQLGMVYYRLHRYNDSRSSYEKAKNCLRGNKFIDYRQLGFVHKLYECDVLYNLALTYATMMNNAEWAIEMLHQASKVAVESRQATLIEKAENQLMHNQLFEPIILPSNQLFRPPQSKVANLKEVNYLGKAKVVSELPESSNNNNKVNFKHPGRAVPPPPNTFRPIDDFSDDSGSPPLFTDGTSSPTPSMVAKMTHKDTISTWNEGVVAFEKGDINQALNQLNSIVDPSAKILYNIGLLQMKLGQLEDALVTFKEVVSKDPHLAIGHFQLGVVLSRLGKFDEAWRSFEKTQETLRGNKMIDYKQLGLQFKLHKCEVLHNQAWTYNELDQPDWARKLLDQAKESKAEPWHDQVDESIQNCQHGHSFKLLEPPKVLLFKPPKSKIDNLNKKDYLGKAKIVAKLPSQRQGASTPPPSSTNSLGVTALPPRSRTPTPREIAQSGPGRSRPPPIDRSSKTSSPPPPVRSVPGLPPRVSPPDNQAPWKLPVPSREMPRSSSPALPNRPPPVLQNGGNRERKQSFGFNPDKALPSAPERSSSPGETDKPPSRPVPSPKCSSPVPERPVPEPPGKKSCSDVPSRPLHPSPKTSVPDLPSRAAPLPPTSDVLNLSSRPVPPRPKTSVSEMLSRTVPPTPHDDVPDLPSRPIPPVPTSVPHLPNRPPSHEPTSSDLPSRPVPPVPTSGVPHLPNRPPSHERTSSDLPSRPVPPAPKTSSIDVPSRPVPSSPNDAVPDLPSRPVPSEPRTTSPDLPSKPLPLSPKKSSSGPQAKAVPPPPQTKKNFRAERRPSSPGLPDLPPPPPPQKSPSPIPRKLEVNNSNSRDRKSPIHGFQAKVAVVADSPPVVRRAAVLNAQTQDKPTLPARPGLTAKPVQEVKPMIKARRGPGQQLLKPGKRKTALVISTYDTDKFGEISVREGDMVSILDEDQDWLQVEFKGQKGRLPRSCVKDFNKPSTNIPF